MNLRFPVSILGGLVFAAALATVALPPAFSPAPSPAWAQNAQDFLSPPSDLPPPGRGGSTYTLDTLFGALKVAPDEASAKAIEDHIWAIWIASGSDTCDLLMSRVKDVTDDKDYDLAIKLLDAIVAIKPDYVEAWNRRATVYYLKRDYGHALADIREVLVREPRHFGALAGLGLILQDIGDDKHALEAYRGALAIDPHLQNLPDVIKSLTEKVEGRDI
jgi:tetratricopeptide (TPR) repeat protein